MLWFFLEWSILGKCYYNLRQVLQFTTERVLLFSETLLLIPLLPLDLVSFFYQTVGHNIRSFALARITFELWKDVFSDIFVNQGFRFSQGRSVDNRCTINDYGISCGSEFGIITFLSKNFNQLRFLTQIRACHCHLMMLGKTCSRTEKNSCRSHFLWHENRGNTKKHIKTRGNREN